MSEELVVPLRDRQRLPDELELVGALNDDSSEVGRRHFAFVFRYEVESEAAWYKPSRGEKAVTELRWLKPSERDFSIRDFEYWSQLCLRTFFSEYVRAEPSFLIRRRTKFTHPHLLCVLGPVGSGKTEATLVFTSDYGYAEINSGVVLANLLGLAPVPKTPRLEFQRAALRFIESATGPKRLAEAIWQDRRVSENARILVDGIRNRSTLRELEKLAGRHSLARIYVHTPADIAFNFYTRRRGIMRTIQDFVNARESPVEREVMEMIEDADAVLYNWIGKMQYRQAVRGMMHELGIAR
jgi:dephospho-CoA kinase